MRQFIFLCASAIIFSNARHLSKRNEQLGDEVVKASTVIEEIFSTTTEQALTTVEGAAISGYVVEVQPLKYLKKRNNQYGDEPVEPKFLTPANAEPLITPAEQDITSVGQQIPAEGYAPETKPSGYRKKRNNDYGDEPVTSDFATVANAEPPVTHAEQETLTIEQQIPAGGYVAEVQPSGYRKKRNNQYGDEPEAAALSTAVITEPLVTQPEQDISTIEQQTTVNYAPEVQPSGYRRKRNNEYGDEPGFEGFSTQSSAEQAISQAEEEVVTVEQQAAPEGGYAAEIQPSGYRKKRNNQYGDEPVVSETLAPETEATQKEEDVVSIQQSTFASEAVPSVEASGYRRKRN